MSGNNTYDLRFMFITVTPINLHNPSTIEGKKAKKDYLREQPFFEKGGAKWDDSSSNQSEVGDWFAFVHQSKKEDRMEWFQILRVESYQHRPGYWDLPQHQQRNVLYLSPKQGEMPFSQWKEEKKYVPRFIVRGTFRTQTSSWFS